MSLAKVLGVKPEPKKVEEVEVKRPKISPFDFVKDIQHPQKNLIVDEWSEGQYNPFMVNKALGFSQDTVIQANEMNSRPFLSKKMQNLFFLNTIRPKKRFTPWVKAEKVQDLDNVKRYYGYSNAKARSVLRVLTAQQLDYIRERLNTGG
jgi:hypothetical protein